MKNILLPLKRKEKNLSRRRPSPSQSAKETKIGTILKGNDKELWIVKGYDGGAQRWVKIPKPPGRTYYIMDNGGHPFKVVIQPKKILIFALDLDFSDTDIYLKKILQINSHKKVFVGNYKGKYYSWSKNFIGNSILVQVASNKYIFIGSEIFSFKMKEPVVAFQSPVGNSGVPYPWVLGARNTYLMIENIWLENKNLNPKNCPYENLYNLDSKKLRALQKSNLISERKILQRRLLG